MINREIYCYVENSIGFDERPIRVGHKKVRREKVGRAQMTHKRSLLAGKQDGTRGTASLVGDLKQRTQPDLARLVLYYLGVFVFAHASHKQRHI